MTRVLKPKAAARSLDRRTLLRALGATAVAGVGASSLAACSQQSSAGGKTPVRIVSWMGFEPGRKEAWAKVIDTFNSQSDTIEVSIGGWPFAQYANNVLTQVQSGGLQGDLITAPPDLAARLLSLDQFKPMSEVIEAAGVTPDANLHEFMRKDGSLYGVSTVTVGFGLLYNQVMLEAAGLTPATTPEEFIAQGTALTERPDTFGVIQANTMAEVGSFWFNLQNTVNAYGGVWAEGSTPMVTSEPVIRSLEFFKQLYDTSMPEGLNDAQLMAIMGDARAAMGVLVSATVNVLKSGSPDVYQDLLCVPPPWAGGTATSRVHPISLYKGSENSEAASEFLTWLLAPENMALLTMESLDAIPPFPELAEVPEWNTYIEGLAWLDGYQEAEPVTPMDLMGDFITANDEFGNIVLQNFQETLTRGTPVAETMSRAQTELEALASRLT